MVFIMEVWKPIPHAPQYLCSNFGNVKSLRYQTILKGSKNSCGYKRVQIGSSKNKHFVHRLVAECFLDAKDGTTVNHKDGNKDNNHVDNLEWCTMKSNNNHAIQTGLRIPVKGENHARSKLTESDAIVIIQLLEQGVNCTQIGRQFNLARKTISDIKNKKTWNHLTRTHGTCQT